MIPTPETQREAEKVYAAITAICASAPSISADWETIARKTREDRILVIAQALAATAERARLAALEEAAQIANDYAKIKHGHLSLNPKIVMQETSEEIASAICALANKPKEGA